MLRNKKQAQRTYSPEHSSALDVSYGRGKAFSDGPIRKYRQVPQSLDHTPNNNVKFREPDSDYYPNDRLAQHEHASLVKVVTRLRDANYFAVQGTHADARVETSPERYNNNTQDWISSSVGDIEHIRGNEDPLLMSTRELARTVAHRVEDDELLETSRRQLEADIYESKRLLQEQMQATTRARSTHDVPANDKGQELEQRSYAVEGEFPSLEAELKGTQTELYAERSMVVKYSEEAATQAQLAKQEHEQRKFLELQMEELKQHCMIENTANLERLALMGTQMEIIKVDTERQQQINEEELLKERSNCAVLSQQTFDLKELLEREKEAYNYQLLQLQEHVDLLQKDKLRLEAEHAVCEEYKRKVEEHRRQYERAGTDILKLLNDANQKVITLEEYKWELEDKATEQRVLYENEKKLFAHARQKLESELTKLNQHFVDHTQQQKLKYEAELEQQQRMFQETITEKESFLMECKTQLNGQIDALRSELDDLRAQMPVLSAELQSTKRKHLSEKEQWAEEKVLLSNEKRQLESAMCIIETNCNNLQNELDDNRRKLEGLKSFLA